MVGRRNCVPSVPNGEGARIPDHTLRSLLCLFSPDLTSLPSTSAPIDTIKTRIQRAQALPGETAWSRVTTVAGNMFREEGFSAFYSESDAL